MPFAWTPAALADLHRLYVRQGLSAAETARVLGGGVTRNAVIGKALRLGWFGGALKPGRKADPDKAAPDRPRLAKPPARPAGGPFSRVLPLPKLREIAVISTPKPWTERGERECAFPVGEPAEPGRQFSCCAPAIRRREYCAAHWRLMTLGETALDKHEIEIVAAIARRAA